MFNVRLAGDHLYGKRLFIWLSLVMSLMVYYFVQPFFPRHVLNEIWEWIGSVPENFSTYFFKLYDKNKRKGYQKNEGVLNKCDSKTNKVKNWYFYIDLHLMVYYQKA